jgi:hypothetical protein
MAKTTPTKLTETDFEAMERAIELYRRRDPASREQIDGMLKDRPWREAAELASYGCQCDRLGLRPWQSPPCEVVGDPDDYEYMKDDHRGLRGAARLLQRLLDAGLSRYEPDPIAALERAEGVTVDAAE